MLLPALLLSLGVARLPVQDPPHAETGEHSHGDDFASILEHRAFADLMSWKERHPWRMGTEVRKFVLRYETERAKGDSEVDRVWDMHAGFLAEVLADDVCTEWLVTVLRFDVETRARFDTVRAALADIAASIPKNQAATDASILADVEGLRPPIAPPWCFETCVEDLVRIAEAARATGHGKAAVEIARQAQAIAERTKDGEIALGCATFLLQTELEAGRRTAAEAEVRRLLGAARDVEHLPADFEKTLAKILERFELDAGIATGIESFRAARAEQEGKDDEALLRWKKAAEQSFPRRFPTGDSSLDAIEAALYGPDPARRGALLAARMGRLEEAWDFVRTAVATTAQCERDAHKMQERRAAQHLDRMLALVVDRRESLVAWFDDQGPGAKILPIGAEGIQALCRDVSTSLQGAGTKEGEPPTSAFDPTAAREMYRVLLQPIGFPLKGRTGVFQTPELESLPLGMLVAGEVPGAAGPARPRYLVEGVQFIRLDVPKGGLHVDEATRSAVRNRVRDLEAAVGNAADALHGTQLEMIQGRGPLGTGRTHPWYWAGFELEQP